MRMLRRIMDGARTVKTLNFVFEADLHGAPPCLSPYPLKKLLAYTSHGMPRARMRSTVAVWRPA
jgi:hypothetical protein